jgi:two-component system, OmpR family, KDP operon response regulator KdpE
MSKMSSAQRHSILVVDDESSLRHALASSLSASGFAVEEARTGEEAVEFAREHSFDLVLLDINMRGISGVEACRRIRGFAPQIGIIMVTVRDSEDDKVRALEAGADDYITKPFLLRELVARLRAVLRRTHAADPGNGSLLRAGNLEMDLERHVLRRSGEEIHLSPKEFELLAFLMKHQDVPLTHVKLLRSIWGAEYGNELEYLRSYIRMLRKKIENDPAKPDYILTEPWVGYRFHNPSDPDSPKPQSDETE